MSAIKGILSLFAGIGVGFATCWFVSVEPSKAELAKVSTLLGKGTGADVVASVESSMQELRAESAAATDRAKKLENEALPAAAKEREALSRELEAARKKETELAGAVSECQEAQRSKDEMLTRVREDLEETKRAHARAAAERDALAQAKAELEHQLADSVPLPRAAVEAACVTPSARARKAQSDVVRESLSPLLALGTYQPLGDATAEPAPFSLRAIQDSGALDRSNPESLYQLWRIVADGENDRSDKWPAYWAPSSTANWLQDWYAFNGGDAIPVLHRAQNLLVELGPTLVRMRMLAP